MKNGAKRLIILALACLASAGAASGQTVDPAADTDAAVDGAVRIFLDCDRGCDFNYLRTEIDFVDYVRDKEDADVHILVTTQSTGSGGREYNLEFIGRRDFSGILDQRRYASSQTDTGDEVRRSLAHTLKLGLMRYVVDSPLASQIRITYDPGDDGARATAGEALRDPWNYWVFRPRINGSLSGEASQDDFSVNGSISANRTTPEWKIDLSTSGRYRRRSYVVDDTTTLISETESFDLSGLVVKSMTGHASVGVMGSVSSSSFTNEKLAVRMATAVEYNLFPYEESTRRQLTVLYSVGVNDFRYAEETIFDKLAERLGDHRLAVAFEARQPWGSAGLSVEASHYLHDLAKHRLDSAGEVEFRLFRGLSLDIRGDASLIRDQLYLPKGDDSAEEILLQRRQLATSYRYEGSIGLSYTFGSIFNNVVNPRFTGRNRSF